MRYKIAGDTYPMRGILRIMGYTYSDHAWYGSTREPVDMLIAKWTRPGYGNKYATMANAIHVEAIDD